MLDSLNDGQPRGPALRDVLKDFNYDVFLVEGFSFVLDDLDLQLLRLVKVHNYRFMVSPWRVS